MLSDAGDGRRSREKIVQITYRNDFSERILSESEKIFRFYFCRKNPKPLYFLTFLQIRLKLQCSYSIIFETIKSNRIQEIVI